MVPCGAGSLFACVPCEKDAAQRRRRDGRGARRPAQDRRRRDAEHHQDERDAHDEAVRRRPDELHDEQADEHHGAARVRDRRRVTAQVAAGRLQCPAEPDDQRRQRDVPDHRHLIIIIAGLRQHVRNVERAVVAAVEGGESVDAGALLFLLRRSRATARDDLLDLLGRGLAQALVDAEGPLSVPAQASWVPLFVEARQLSDDERLDTAIDRLTVQLREHWHDAGIADSASAIGAVLHAVSLDPFRSLASETIDELERLVRDHYRPGEPLGGFADQVWTASALLTAYGLCGRLPYSMLAEELMQPARRAPLPEFATSCEAARVLCRLAALHDDDQYRAAAVLAPDADYRADAARMLSNLSDVALRRGAAAGIYGVAVLELESGSSLP